MVSIKRTVLVVEDDRDISDTIVTLLSLHGYALRIASDRDFGMELLREHGEPDAVIVDYHMPGMTLEAFVREARELFPSIRIVLVSADHSVAGKAQSLQIPHWLKKPIDPDQLIQLVDLVSQRRSN